MGETKRRRFLIGVGALLAASVGAWAQQAKKTRIGMLFASNPEPGRRLILEGLRKLGYVDGQNIQVEFRSADGKPGLLPGLAAELVRLKVDVILAVATPAVHAAKQATNQIPIVMAPAGDPVGTGLVASLARPGGNVTGLSATTAESTNKLLEFIRELLPQANRVGVLANPTDPFTKPFLEQIDAAARALKVETRTIMIGGGEEFDAAFAELHKIRAGAVIVQPSLPRQRAIELALQYRLASFSPTPTFPQAGGLLSYSAGYSDMYYEAATYVDKIVKGRKPAELPVQQPMRFELVINLKTAGALGLKIPRRILVLADKLIE